MSGGDFKWMTPYIPNKKPGQVDEATDTADTIDWLLKGVANNNGKVGVYGTSFPGHYAAQAMIEPHPALAAVSPQAPMADNWLGDDMHHNGAFFLPHAMGFIAGFGKKREGPTQNYGSRVFDMGTPDGYRFYLEMGPLARSLSRYNMNQIELWKEWLAHPDYDAYWQAQNVPQHLKKVGNLPVLLVGGWWDAEDLYGPLAIYSAIEKANPVNRTKLVMGPWYHGSWNRGPGTSLHDIVWKTATGDIFRDTVQRPFFRHHLWGDIAEPAIPEALVFDAGADTFKSYAQWPPASSSKRLLVPGMEVDGIRFDGGGNEHDPLRSVLKIQEPATAPRLRVGGGPTLYAEAVQWFSDPAKPVPASAFVSPGMPRSYLIEDQRFAWSRPDVISFETPVLTEAISLAGPVKATLQVSTTGTDADFVVKLIDVFPGSAANNSPRGTDVNMGGYQMLVRGEPIRARYRNSWSKPEAMKSNTITKVEFSLPDVCHTFKKGHRIMVQVQSSWFPVIDRNPQKFVNIMMAKPEDFQKATHRLYLSGGNTSSIEVTVAKQ